jgi:hypothetical protein
MSSAQNVSADAMLEWRQGTEFTVTGGIEWKTAPIFQRTGYEA